MRRILKFMFFGILLIGNMLPISADEEDAVPTMGIPFTKSYYYHFSRDQQLGALVKDFCSMQGISVVVSPVVTDVVNGRFNKMNPAEFWDYITQAYSLSWFYDGKILYVYKSSELQTQIFKMDATGINTMSNILKHLGFSSSDFSFRSVPDANILIVTAPPRYLATINDLSAKFVAEKITDTTIVKTFPLKYAWAYDMSFTYKDSSISVPGVCTLLQNIVSGRQTPFAMSGMEVNLSDKKQQQLHKSSYSQGLSTQKNQNKNSANKDSDSKGKSNDEEDSKKSEDTQTAQTLPGFITCDQRLNAVIIRDKYENMPFYEDIIKQLDVPCDVIKIDVAIVDVDIHKSMDLGLDALGMVNDNNGKPNHQKTLNIGVSGQKQDSASLSVNGGNTFGQLKGVLKGYSISAYLRAMESHGSAKTVAKPSVLTLDNVGAVISKDRTSYQTVTGRYGSDMYDIAVSTKMQVVPHIIPGDVDKDGKRKMKMFVNVQDGSAAETTKEGATPETDTSAINTQAVLYEGQCLLIGGYFKEETKDSAAGVPFLQRIPLIGKAFKVSTDNKQIIERIYVVSPTVVNIDEQDNKFDHFMQGGDLENKGQFGAFTYQPQKKKKFRWKKR